MADPFSIAVGVAGVVSLSLQLVQRSRKLSGILKSIVDLPDEVESMLIELDILSDVLQQGGDASVAGKKAKQQLQRLSKLLQSLLDDTQTYISRTKHKVSWKAIKATMRKDETNQLYQRMERCLRLLQLVNQMDFHTMQTRQLGVIQQSQSKDSENIALILKHISKLSVDTQRHETSDSTSHKMTPSNNTVINRPARNRSYGSYWDFIACCWIVLGFVQLYKSSSKNRRIIDDDPSDECNIAEQSSWKIKFQAAQWLTSRGFTIWRTACFGDWKYQLQPHRLRPKDAPIFEACRNGKVEDVGRLLSKGEASPFDIDEQGLTPLHYAVQFRYIDVCRLLIDRGADCNESLHCISNLLIFLALSPKSDQENCQARSIWLQLAKLLVEEGQCDPTTPHHAIKNYILHEWYGPMETLKWLCRQDQFWFEFPVSGALGHTYHSLAMGMTGTWSGGPSILLNILWTEERAPYILHSRNDDGRTVLFAAVWRQAWLATIGRQDRLRVRDSSVDKLVTRLIQDGSDVHALDSSGSTPLNKALCLFVMYCDSSPLKALNFAHESRKVFRLEKIPLEYRIPGSQSGSGAHLDGSPGSIWRFGQFLHWWFEKLDDSGYDLNDYIRQEETLHPPMCRVGRDAAVLGAKISKIFHYDKSAQRLELNVEYAWTKIGDIKDLSKPWETALDFPYIYSEDMI